ncbi:unnamed protein product, partial [Mesorhabditis belari]
MDAEKVFKIVADTGSVVRFASGEGVTLRFNNELRIHPAALEQLHAKGNNDLRDVLQLTKDFTAGTIPEVDYLLRIKETFGAKHRMMVDT